MFTALRVAVVLLSIGAAFMTFRTGDLGAKAVWAGWLQAAHGGDPGIRRYRPVPPPGTGAP